MNKKKIYSNVFDLKTQANICFPLMSNKVSNKHTHTYVHVTVLIGNLLEHLQICMPSTTLMELAAVQGGREKNI